MASGRLLECSFVAAGVENCDPVETGQLHGSDSWEACLAREHHRGESNASWRVIGLDDQCAELLQSDVMESTAEIGNSVASNAEWLLRIVPCVAAFFLLREIGLLWRGPKTPDWTADYSCLRSKIL